MAYRKARRSKYNKKQRGGGDLRPEGRIRRGSGMSDITSPINAATGQHYTVDDVPALLGANEFVVNSQAAQAVGYEFLEKINNIGTTNSNQFARGTLIQHGSNYQKGGRVRRQRGGRGRVGKQMGSGCPPGQIMQNGACVPTGGSGYRRGGKVRGRVRRQQGGTHSHSYSPGVRNHWSKFRGGQRQGTQGYLHTHGGSTHPHNFSPEVRSHWSAHPGGEGRGTQGYSHSHMRRGGRIRRQMGGPGNNLPQPWRSYDGS